MKAANTERAAEYTISPADKAGEGLHQVRVIVHECSMLDFVRRERYEQEALAWLQDAHGIGPAELAETDLDPDVASIFVIARHTRPICLSATARWEKRIGSGEWEPCDPPADWVSVEGFARNAPQVFVRLWEYLANECNPGLFRVSMSPAEKKSGSVKETVLRTN